MMQPYTENDLQRAEKLVRELHGLKGFDAWADRIAKEIAAARARGDRPLDHPPRR